MRDVAPGDVVSGVVKKLSLSPKPTNDVEDQKQSTDGPSDAVNEVAVRVHVMAQKPDDVVKFPHVRLPRRIMKVLKITNGDAVEVVYFRDEKEGS